MSSLPAIPMSIGHKRLMILRAQSIMAGLVERIGLGRDSTDASRAAVFANPALTDEVAQLGELLLWAEEEQANLDRIEAKWDAEQQQRRSKGILDLHGSSFSSPLEEARADKPFKDTCGSCGEVGHQSAKSRHCLNFRVRDGSEGKGQGEGHEDNQEGKGRGGGHGEASRDKRKRGAGSGSGGFECDASSNNDRDGGEGGDEEEVVSERNRRQNRRVGNAGAGQSVRGAGGGSVSGPTDMNVN